MIVIGYPGVGKTTLCGRERGTIDLESMFFHGSAKEKNWEQLYCEVALDLSKQGYIVFVSSHHEVCEKIKCLRNPDIDEVVAVYPKSDERMKTQWIQRLRNRVDMNPISYDNKSNFSAALDKKEKRALKRAEDHYFEDTSAMSKLPFCRIELSTMRYDLLKEIAEVHKSRCDPATIHKVMNDKEKINASNGKHRESCQGCEHNNTAPLINGKVFHFCATQEGMTHYDPNFGEYGNSIPEWCPYNRDGR